MNGTMVALALALVGLVAWYFLHQPKVPAATSNASAGVDLSAVHPADVPVIMHSWTVPTGGLLMPDPTTQVDPPGADAIYAADFQKAMNLSAASMGAAAAASASQNEYYRTHPQ